MLSYALPVHLRPVVASVLCLISLVPLIEYEKEICESNETVEMVRGTCNWVL